VQGLPFVVWPRGVYPMDKYQLYAQLDIEKLKKFEEATDEKLSLIEKIFFHVKYFIASFLPEPFAELMMGIIGDVIVFIIFLTIFSIILKAIGMAFKLVWRVFIFILFIYSVYVLYKYFFS